MPGVFVPSVKVGRDSSLTAEKSAKFLWIC